MLTGKQGCFTRVSLPVLGLLLLSTTARANPPISWEPNKLITEQEQGSLVIHIVRMTASEDLDKSYLRVVPELRQWVRVTPSEIEPMPAGSQTDVSVSINLPPDAPLGAYDGVISLNSRYVGRPALAKPLPVELSITEMIDDGLPPDPGEEGKLTLLGVDSDSNGVRDDVQRYIHSNYGDEPPLVRMAIDEIAKQFQLILAGADDENASYSNALKMSRHKECLYFLKGRDSLDISSELKAEILNTGKRSKAYLRFNNILAGEIFVGKPVAQWPKSCAFDVEATGGGQ